MPPLLPSGTGTSSNPEDERGRIVNVLITGFGPFRNFTENPSWLAVKPLHNTIIPLDPYDPVTLPNGQVVMTGRTHPTGGIQVGMDISPVAEDGVINLRARGDEPGERQDGQTKGERTDEQRPMNECYAKITTLEIPVVYEDVLAIVPGLHRKPPELPPSDDLLHTHPPPQGYDFIFHVGVAGRGPLRVEGMAHKLGYHMKDAKGELAPIVQPTSTSVMIMPEVAPITKKDIINGSVSVTSGPGGIQLQAHPETNGNSRPRSPPSQSQAVFSAVSVAEAAERERLGAHMVEELYSGTGVPGTGPGGRPLRGFGEGYRRFAEELYTDIDVLELVRDLKRSGIETVTPSLDAGHYLCDFIYYCSLAEAQRNGKPYEKDQTTKVLFLHCPPVNQPCSTEETTEAIKRIVVWVCAGLGGTI
ncbi:peptidaseC15,pyroglutamyl peptidaseI-likeprotein [Moniliophthora roreri MCA 2997]|uniref:PeptidaseC15,pyroglutamyl peptidaseI-likeprotein n=1 Tax=Moniliophthora roreri (strain MCA 2997) TaxID=1381753 RepID=V2XDW6_MONRO|nr:peptidaseC15,pyroglutamyl peptidaseI-likeprotein [Moniliophthora roreri MCA 2997]